MTVLSHVKPRMLRQNNGMAKFLGNRKKQHAFTIIELLCVMTIIALLVAGATQSFLDFRKEARLASVRHALNTMRVGYKNMQQQFMLRCGAPAGAVTSWIHIRWNYIQANAWTSDWFVIPPMSVASAQGSCPTSIPAHERKFWDGPGGIGISGPDFMPTNPFESTYPELLAGWSQGLCSDNDCGCDDLASAGYVNTYPWWHHQNTGEIFAGTNYGGECDF